MLSATESNVFDSFPSYIGSLKVEARVLPIGTKKEIKIFSFAF